MSYEHRLLTATVSHSPVPCAPGAAAAGGAGPAGMAPDAAGGPTGTDGRSVCQRRSTGRLLSG